MANVVLTTITNGTLADASVVMANFNAIIAQVNGNIDQTNIKNGSVTQPKLDPTIPFALFTDATHRIAHGSTGVVWNGAAGATVLTVPHGLGSAPSRVFAQPHSGALIGGFPVAVIVNVSADATNVVLSVFVPSGNPTNGTSTVVDWQAWV